MHAKSILFLDIDGVLNSVEWAESTQARGIWGIDPNTMPLLQEIIDVSGCDIVISSSWRLIKPLAEIRGQLIGAGLRSPVPILDKTPNLGGQKRGHEIAKWIEWTRWNGPYAILDDDSDFLPDQPLVRTSIQHGLTSAHVKRVLELI